MYNIHVVFSIKKNKDMIYAIYGLETGSIVIVDHENVGLHIRLSTMRWLLYEILLKNVVLLMATFSSVSRNDVLIIMTLRFNNVTSLIIFITPEMLVWYRPTRQIHSM